MQQYRKIAELNTFRGYLLLQSNDAALYKHDVLKYRYQDAVVLCFGEEGNRTSYNIPGPT